ncbi:hypothetical protein [Catellatospora tritici]|uniref:hypothetical protein n=1 Tax=Catellatospora tritici TaxID=2851566 RepID=UPI001C2D0978|nr:hypothetical protein [Catellatospora tritici]
MSGQVDWSGALRWCAETHCAACGFTTYAMDDVLSAAERAAVAAQEGWFALLLTPADSADPRVRSAVRHALDLTFAQVVAMFRECPRRPVTGLRVELDLVVARIRRAAPRATPTVEPLP